MEALATLVSGTGGQAPPETGPQVCEEPWPSLAKGYPFASASWVHCSAPQELSNLGLEVSGALNLSTIRVISSHIMAGSLRTWTQQEAQGGSNGAEGWRLGRRH